MTEKQSNCLFYMATVLTGLVWTAAIIMRDLVAKQ